MVGGVLEIRYVCVGNAGVNPEERHIFFLGIVPGWVKTETFSHEDPIGIYILVSRGNFFHFLPLIPNSVVTVLRVTRISVAISA